MTRSKVKFRFISWGYQLLERQILSNPLDPNASQFRDANGRSRSPVSAVVQFSARLSRRSKTANGKSLIARRGKTIERNRTTARKAEVTTPATSVENSNARSNNAESHLQFRRLMRWKDGRNTIVTQADGMRRPIRKQEICIVQRVWQRSARRVL